MFWLVLEAAHMVSWFPLIPCKYLESFKGVRSALKCCTQSYICMLYVNQNINFKGNAHGQPTRTLKDFESSDCFLQLRIWSAGPHSFLVNIQVISIAKGRAQVLHWYFALKQSYACCTKQQLNILKETLGAHGQPTATLKNIGGSDCFLQLHIWSPVPTHSL